MLLKKIFFLVGWVFVAACKLSLVAAAGDCCSSCGAWTSYCSGFSCCRAWALGAWASEAAAPGPSSCSLQALGLEGFSSCGAWIPESRLLGPRVQFWHTLLGALRYVQSARTRD